MARGHCKTLRGSKNAFFAILVLFTSPLGRSGKIPEKVCHRKIRAYFLFLGPFRSGKMVKSIRAINFLGPFRRTLGPGGPRLLSLFGSLKDL